MLGLHHMLVLIFGNGVTGFGDIVGIDATGIAGIGNFCFSQGSGMSTTGYITDDFFFE